VLKLTLCGLAFGLCVCVRPAFAQSSDNPSPLPAPPPPPPVATVPLPPQSREEPPQPLPDSEPGLTWGDRQGDWRPLHAGAPVTPLQEPTLTRQWYGWQILTSDAVTLSFFGFGLALQSGSNPARRDDWLTAGALGYAFVPAVIHLGHLRPGMAVASATVRLMLPTAIWAVTAAGNCQGPAGDDGDEFCGGTGPTVALLAGIALASAIDAALFSWDSPRAKEPDAASFGFAPVFAPDGKRAELRAYGKF
jgi:hypothetical protein